MANTDVVKSETQSLQWSGAAKNAVIAKAERDQIIQNLLTDGVDFGKPYPSAPKPTLLKPGAEKICDAVNVYPDYEIVSSQERWDIDNPLFVYTVKCSLVLRGTNFVVGTGIGSCNSMEEKYYYRNQKPVCTKCGQDAIIKSNPEYGGGYYCYPAKGGCGAKFESFDDKPKKIKNPAIFDQVNTILKMAEKRAHVAATLTMAGFSDRFTQDIEDAEVVSVVTTSNSQSTGDATRTNTNDNQPELPDCPECGKMLRQDKKEALRYYCWKAKGGCGEAFRVNTETGELTNEKGRQGTSAPKPGKEAEQDPAFKARKEKLVKMAEEVGQPWLSNAMACLPSNIDALEKAINAQLDKQ